jgi:uncharacterized membrane protein
MKTKSQILGHDIVKSNSLNPNGRPKKRDEDKLSESVLLKLTKSQKNKIETIAQQRGVAVNMLIRNQLASEGLI